VGLILCADKGHALARYALDGLPTKVMAANYRTVLPDAELLQKKSWRTRGVCLNLAERCLSRTTSRSCAFRRTAVGLAGCALCFVPNHSHAALIPDAFGLDR